MEWKQDLLQWLSSLKSLRQFRLHICLSVHRYKSMAWEERWLTCMRGRHNLFSCLSCSLIFYPVSEIIFLHFLVLIVLKSLFSCCHCFCLAVLLEGRRGTDHNMARKLGGFVQKNNLGAGVGGCCIAGMEMGTSLFQM